ncbi:MAG: MFS transporter [Nocardioidaceae bacterium]|nr:MFS transporter [Nocardioidaceae bacterium]MCL2614018.1 MFS transporter [Nocardioidaceae bacterium]
MQAKTAVGVVFALNGLTFSCLAARLPDVRADLGLDNGALGLLLLAIAVGSIAALSIGGHLIARLGPATVVRIGTTVALSGFALTAIGVSGLHSTGLTAAAFAMYGVGIATWDLAMNVEAAEVERALGRTIMPRFHAGWSLGSFGGAGVGVALIRWDVPAAAHLVVGGLIGAAGAAAAARWFLGSSETPEPVAATSAAAAVPVRARRSTWTEPRTLAIGLMVLCFAAVEGAANDWLSLALIDGYDAPHWVGVAGFALFVSAMTTGRLLGPLVLDRFGRVPVLALTAVVSGGGVLLVVFGAVAPVIVLGILLWGLGAALGFPVGISAAADDPAGAARRVSVVSTIGYGAFMAGPPLLGALGDHVGTLRALIAVAVLMAVAAATVPAARKHEPAVG